MTTHTIWKHAGKILLGAALLGALGTVWEGLDWFAPEPVSAQGVIVPWTAVGASGTVDEGSIAAFGFTNASAGYAAIAALSPLEFRYNVTNTFDNSTLGPNIPGWTTLELGAQAPGASSVTAALFRVARCTGKRTLICSVRIVQATTGVCKVCTFANTAVNFTADLFYVDATVARSTPSEQPFLHTLRIF
ncbi:MAG TPA: hypothetical protein VFA33_19770 [Bryobacteraceae bacterium]|nr:hypothetical protein [Bryobacteraceae bacterium]